MKVKALPTRKYLGFDCSSKAVHLTILNENSALIDQKKWSATFRDTEKRFNDIVDGAEEFLKDLNPEEYIASIENPIYVNNMKATVSITNVIAGVKRALHTVGIEDFPVDNKSWKKAVLGNGSSSKEEILKFAESRWGKEFKEQDWADAACVSLWLYMRMNIPDN